MGERDEIIDIPQVKEIIGGFRDFAVATFLLVPPVFFPVKFAAAGSAYVAGELGKQILDEAKPQNYLKPEEETFVSFQSRIEDLINNAGHLLPDKGSVSQLLEDPDKTFSTLHNLLEDASSSISNFVTDTKIGAAGESINHYIHELVEGNEDLQNIKEKVDDVTDWAKDAASDISNFFHGESGNENEAEYTDFVKGSDLLREDGSMDFRNIEDDVAAGDNTLNGNDNLSGDSAANEVGDDMGWSEGKAEGDVEGELDTDIGADYEDVGMDMNLGEQGESNSISNNDYQYDGILNGAVGDFEENLSSIMNNNNNSSNDNGNIINNDSDNYNNNNDSDNNYNNNNNDSDNNNNNDSDNYNNNNDSDNNYNNNNNNTENTSNGENNGYENNHSDNNYNNNNNGNEYENQNENHSLQESVSSGGWVQHSDAPVLNSNTIEPPTHYQPHPIEHYQPHPIEHYQPHPIQHYDMPTYQPNYDGAYLC